MFEDKRPARLHVDSLLSELRDVCQRAFPSCTCVNLKTKAAVIDYTPVVGKKNKDTKPWPSKSPDALIVSQKLVGPLMMVAGALCSFATESFGISL